LNRSFLLRFLIDGSGRAATVLLVVLLARALAVEEFGKLSFALSCAVILGFVAEGGIHFLFLREMGAGGGGALWKDFFGLKLLLAAAAAALGAAVVPFLWPWEGAWVPVAVIGYVLGNSVVDFFHQACNAADRFGASAAVTASHRAACFAAVLAALGLGGGLTRLSAALCAGSAAGAFLGYLVLKGRLEFVSAPAWRPAAWLGRVRESVPLALASFFFMATTRVGVLALSWMGLTAEAGLYGAAQRLFDAGTMLPAALMNVALPRFARTLASDPEALGREARATGLTAAGIALAILAGGELLAEPVVRLFFGERYAGAVPLLRVLLVASALIMLNYYLVTLLLVFRRQARHSAHEALGLAAAAALTFWLVRERGAAGAAWALVLTELMLLSLTAFALRPAAWRRAREAARA
jgi:O-antigen/teichoic acid export membrane protein